MSGTFFHALSHEESEEIDLSGLVFRDLSWVGINHFLGDHIECPGVIGLAEFETVDDLVGRSSVSEEFFYDGFRIGTGEFIFVDEFDHTGEFARREEECIDGIVFVGGLEESKEYGREVRA